MWLGVKGGNRPDWTRSELHWGILGGTMGCDSSPPFLKRGIPPYTPSGFTLHLIVECMCVAKDLGSHPLSKMYTFALDKCIQSYMLSDNWSILYMWDELMGKIHMWTGIRDCPCIVYSNGLWVTSKQHCTLYKDCVCGWILHLLKWAWASGAAGWNVRSFVRFYCTSYCKSLAALKYLASCKQNRVEDTNHEQLTSSIAPLLGEEQLCWEWIHLSLSFNHQLDSLFLCWSLSRTAT